MSKQSVPMVAAVTATIIACVPAVAALETGRLDCPDREVIVKDLHAAGEQRVAVGVKPEGIVMEIYVARNGDWTEIWTRPRAGT